MRCPTPLSAFYMLLDDAREGLRPEFIDRRKNAK